METIEKDAPATGHPSEHPGMGAVLHDGGATFRVWAPYAEAVLVTGSFDGWSRAAHPMAPEDGGTWSTFVGGVAAGDAYKFVLTAGGATFDRNDPYARCLTNSVGNALVYDPAAFDWEGDAFERPAWNALVLYELHVGTFAPEDDGPGDLHGALRQLDHLVDLGVNAVSLMPLAEFAGDVSWGYNPAHLFAVESAYGGPDAFKRFVREAHRRGLAVLLDVVYNHFGPSDLDLWRFDGWHEGDYGGIYFYNDPRAETPWGATRPDYGREEVRRFIRDSVWTWLDEFHLDGLRWDGTVFIRRTHFDASGENLIEGWELMQSINREVQAQRPGTLMIAEDLQNDAAVTAPPEHGGAGFSAQWDAAFVHPVRAALIAARDEDRNVGAVRDALQHRYGDDAFRRVVYTESHDEVANGQARVPEEIAPGEADGRAAQKRSTLGAVLVFTAPGIPMIFQGQELLEDRHFDDTRPLDWTRADDFAGITQLYRDLVALRRNLHGTTRGLTGQHLDVFHQNDVGKVLAYHRWADGGPADSTVVVINLANCAHDAYEIAFPQAGTWHVRLNSDWGGYSDAFDDHPVHTVEAEAGEDGAVRGTLALPPYTALILSQNAAEGGG
ncbi:MAG: alpha-amylase family glycosyl hydrolase [Rhodothermales bacterium]|nr:alpha-amylase family glycosyl hydrolase [Rhodothermales bacterium]